MIKYNIDIELDSPERTIHHRSYILEKKFLNELYKKWYNKFIAEFSNLPDGKLVEIGSGSGFFKQVAPQVICTDILDLPTNDMTISALDMPFEDESISGIFMIDTFHHLPDVELFLKESNRVLKKGGKIIMIEPANSAWARFIYSNFHHEPFEPKANWKLDSTGPLSGANGALPWIVFSRDHELFHSKFPKLKLEAADAISPIQYLLSGGLSYRQLLPNFMYPVVNYFDNVTPKVSKEFSMFTFYKIIKL